MKRARVSRAKARVVISGEGFRRARIRCGLDVERCAKLLRVDPRTVRNWEAERTAAPYSAYRMLRLELGARLPGEAWRGWSVVRDELHSPNGERFSVQDMLWLSLSLRRAEAFSIVCKRLRVIEQQAGGLGAAAPQEGSEVTP